MGTKEKKETNKTDMIYRLIGEADGGFIEEMLDENTAKRIKASNLAKARSIRVLCCAAAAAAVVVGMHYIPAAVNLQTQKSADTHYSEDLAGEPADNAGGNAAENFAGGAAEEGADGGSFADEKNEVNAEAVKPETSLENAEEEPGGAAAEDETLKSEENEGTADAENAGRDEILPGITAMDGEAYQDGTANAAPAESELLNGLYTGLLNSAEIIQDHIS